MPGNVGSSTPGAAPKHREEEPQVSPHGQKHQKTSTVTVNFWVATPKSCCKISFNPREYFDDYRDAKARWILRAAVYPSCGQ